ncbi:MAG: hydrolase or acyltransferase, alpha/beta fold family [Caulobacteraceae bacterium]|nr:hydrolase or acyltransferase, alpha/beta fold family [Caulobacteraceae bacterium]
MPSSQHEIMIREVLPRFAPRPSDTFEAMRLRWEEEAQKLAPPDLLLRSERVRIGEMGAAWVWRGNIQSPRVVLYVHGGGYVQGSVESYRGMAGRVAQAVGGRAFLFDYRLSPEHQFPAALDDACMAYDWLLSAGNRPRDIAIMGDSAGGGLALATLLKLRDDGRPLPSAGICLSPLADFEASGDSARPGAVDDPMIPAAAIPVAGEMYAPGQLRHPLVSPIFGDFTGLPPLLIFVGTREVLLDDAVRIHNKAEQDGVDVTLMIKEGLIHAWPFFGPDLPETQEVLVELRSFLGRNL